MWKWLFFWRRKRKPVEWQEAFFVVGWGNNGRLLVLRWESGRQVAEGDFVLLQGRRGRTTRYRISRLLNKNTGEAVFAPRVHGIPNNPQ